MELRPQSEGWAGPLGLFRMWVPCIGCLLLRGWVARGGGLDVGWGGTEGGGGK